MRHHSSSFSCPYFTHLPLSMTQTLKSLSCSAQSCLRRMEAARPAGPPPTMRTSNGMDSRGSSRTEEKDRQGVLFHARHRVDAFNERRSIIMVKRVVLTTNWMATTNCSGRCDGEENTFCERTKKRVTTKSVTESSRVRSSRFSFRDLSFIQTPL